MESRIREAILSIVPMAGSRIGSKSLIRKVLESGEAAGYDFSETANKEVRGRLIEEGVPGKGRGRSGSVYRVDATDGGIQSSVGVSTPAELTPPANGQYGSYQHQDKATLWPDVGVQDQFAASRRPKEHRYDSSLAPELAWNENANRDFAELLPALITEAVEQGEAEVFANPQHWVRIEQPPGI